MFRQSGTLPATTHQSHLTQHAKYEAIKNTISYNVLPKYIRLYHSLTKQKENENPDDNV
ncbi:hypothetical protein O0S10_07485 [Methanocorpusculum sp. MG]|uniref:Integrase SSV1 C-terminal domain-containing protein n=1 Tax=Methanocorpusculum petauri TaxID=3002863 RepID=A0ABT4IH42_9EURY|nr:hypothetical protein [Methanocorpusculum petauri]MCZ0861066.1 hypothetical protein [Methanocorpusculum petauri]